MLLPRKLLKRFRNELIVRGYIEEASNLHRSNLIAVDQAGQVNMNPSSDKQLSNSYTFH